MGANPVDRGKPGSKLHLVCDASGLPLTPVVTAANAGDTTMFQALLDDIPAVLTPSGRRRRRPDKVYGDKAYNSAANRAYLRRGIKPRIARRGIDSSARLGRHRCKVERSLSWLSCWRAPAGALGPGLGAVVRVRAGGLCGRLPHQQGSGVLVVARCCLDGWLAVVSRSRPVRRVWV